MPRVPPVSNHYFEDCVAIACSFRNCFRHVRVRAHPLLWFVLGGGIHFQVTERPVLRFKARVTWFPARSDYNGP